MVMKGMSMSVRMNRLFVLLPSLIIIVATATIVTAYTVTYDHKLKDLLSLITSMEFTVEGILKHARDYTFASVEFIAEELEESRVSKHKQPVTSIISYYEYELVEDIRYKANEAVAVSTKAEVSIPEEEEEGVGEGIE